MIVSLVHCHCGSVDECYWVNGRVFFFIHILAYHVMYTFMYIYYIRVYFIPYRYTLTGLCDIMNVISTKPHERRSLNKIQFFFLRLVVSENAHLLSTI